MFGKDFTLSKGHSVSLNSIVRLKFHTENCSKFQISYKHKTAY